MASSASGGTLRTRSGGGSGSRTKGLGALAAKGGGKAVGEGKAVTERRIKGKIKMSGGEDIGGTGDFEGQDQSFLSGEAAAQRVLDAGPTS